MSRLNATDIQGFVLRGYNSRWPVTSFFTSRIPSAPASSIGRLLGVVTTGQRWDQGKPQSTVNIAFSHAGLVSLDLPIATIISFPVEFQQGMKARSGILGDTGANSPEHWDPIWRDGHVHAWLGVNAQSQPALEAACANLQKLLDETEGATILGSQDAAAIVLNGQPTTKEHFGFTDGFGNPDYLGVERSTQPGQGKLTPDGKWVPLATGELLLGYADEAGELPVAPVPHLLASNGTFMVYRKLHQNVATFRQYLNEWGEAYPGGKEKLASKFIGRWRDGTPVGIIARQARSIDRARPESKHQLYLWKRP